MFKGFSTHPKFNTSLELFDIVLVLIFVYIYVTWHDEGVVPEEQSSFT